MVKSQVGSNFAENSGKENAQFGYATYPRENMVTQPNLVKILLQYLPQRKYGYIT